MKSQTWRVFGTTAVLAVTARCAFDEARERVLAELESVDRACSRFRDDSELVRVNAANGRTTHVSPLFFGALQTALSAAAMTDGLVDPTLGRSLRLSGYDRTFAVVRRRDGTFRPSFARDPDWHTVELDERRRTVRVPQGVELDLGATAKALAADRCARAAFEVTGVGVLVSLGGDVAVAGDPPQDGWPVRIAEDNAAPLDEPGPTITIDAGGLATSGTTVRRWTTSDGELHHIIDPRTRRPAETYWRTATVAAASCVDANTASTAAIVLGEHAESWLGQLRLPARLVRYDGAVACVGDWPEEAG